MTEIELPNISEEFREKIKSIEQENAWLKKNIDELNRLVKAIDPAQCVIQIMPSGEINL